MSGQKTKQLSHSTQMPQLMQREASAAASAEVKALSVSVKPVRRSDAGAMTRSCRSAKSK